MFISEIPFGIIILFVSGGISIFALILSKILTYLKNYHSPDNTNNLMGYECGFESEINENFVYVTEKTAFVAVFLILELITFWLLLCCTFDIMTKNWSGKFFIRILILAIFLIIFLSYRFLFHQNAQK